MLVQCTSTSAVSSSHVYADEEWVNVMMSKIDLNGDGGISIDDFVEFNAK